MKKKMLVAALLIIIVMTAAALAACNDPEVGSVKGKTYRLDSAMVVLYESATQEQKDAMAAEMGYETAEEAVGYMNMMIGGMSSLIEMSIAFADGVADVEMIVFGRQNSVSLEYTQNGNEILFENASDDTSDDTAGSGGMTDVASAKMYLDGNSRIMETPYDDFGAAFMRMRLAEE